MQRNIKSLKNAIAYYKTMHDVVYSKIVRKDLSNVNVSFKKMKIDIIKSLQQQ